MKRRISDLLDSVPADPVELKEVTPLSSSRIKELTMSKLEHREMREKKHRTGLRRLGFNILVAAATISLLTVTVSAAEYIFGAGDWFKGRMEQQLEEGRTQARWEDPDANVAETISQGQIDTVNRLGQSFQEQTVTQNGASMTMTAAYGDAHVMHAYVRVKAPQGTVLPDDILYNFFSHREGEDGFDYLTVADGSPYAMGGYIIEASPLEDGDPTDNKKDFDIAITGQLGQEAAFNDGVAKYLHLGGLFEQVVDANGDEDGYEPFFTGDFTFDIGLINQAEVCKVDVSKAGYGGHVVRQWTHEGVPHNEGCAPYDENGVHTEEYDYTVSPDYLYISPLTAQWKCHFTCTDERIAPGLQFQIVMKDGTTAVGIGGGGGELGDDFSSGLTIFSAPLDLDQVDYILIGDPNVGEPMRLELPR
ncbi:MAG: hypothetical protein Q4F17_04205 [Eubacteriales bacterium]|nr:hypothetical protein [Eubacteriales bacterium]